MGGLLDGRKEVANVSQLLGRLDLRKGAAKAKPRVFSGGNQQKVIIARWLLGSSAIFMFDEPTQGIDVSAREQVHKVIRELAARGSSSSPRRPRSWHVCAARCTSCATALSFKYS